MLVKTPRVEMHRTCPLQCSAEAEHFGAQAERVPKFGRTSAEYFFSTTNDEYDHLQSCLNEMMQLYV